MKIEILQSHYAIRDLERDFARGRRSNLVYAVPSTGVGYAKVNPSGPEPIEYVDFAKSDLSQDTPQSGINALSNAKRAIHQAVEAVLTLLAVNEVLARAPFPEKLKVFEELEAFPVRLLGILNRRRNLIEHDYRDVSAKDAAALVDIAELFVPVAYQYFQNTVSGVYVGLKDEDQCLEYRLDVPTQTISEYRVEAGQWLDTEHGRLHYNITNDMPRTEVDRVHIDKANRSELLRYLDPMVYCTRRVALKLPPGPPGLIALRRVEYDISKNPNAEGRPPDASAEPSAFL